jgi:hypothetical protein
MASDVADEIRKAVHATAPPGARSNPPERMVIEEDFLKLRAHVRGTLIAAKQQMNPGEPWDITTDRILDIVTTWMESLRR